MNLLLLIYFSSPRLHTLLRGLSPAILRVGGSPADWLVFDVPQKRLAPLTMKKPLISMTREINPLNYPRPLTE